MKKHRLSIDLSPEGKAQLELLQKKVGAFTMIEVVRKSMAILELICDHIGEGGKVVLENKDGTREALRLI